MDVRRRRGICAAPCGMFSKIYSSKLVLMAARMDASRNSDAQLRRFSTRVIDPMSATRFSIEVMMAFLALTACESPLEPGLPSGAIAMHAPKPYDFWWKLTEACSGKTGTISTISWYYVPGVSEFELGGTKFVGYWFQNSNSIVLAGTAILHGQVVRHEMLHALTGSGAHVRAYFVDACGGVVACDDFCAREAGVPAVPDTTAPEMPVSALDLESAVQPSSPSLMADSGWVAISESVQNASSGDAWFRLSPVDSGSAYSATFGYIVNCVAACQGGGGSGYAYVESHRFGLLANATKRYVFDFQLLPGTYGIRATFNDDTTGETLVTVTP
jgi:hypothetical protein